MIYYSASSGGFYIDSIHKVMPEDVVEISQEFHRELLEGQSNGKEIKADGQGRPYLENPSPEILSEAKLRMLKMNNKAYEEAVQLHTSMYPQSEKDTWPTQDREIKAWVADPENAITSWIDAAALVRGIPREEYLQRTLIKTQQFEQLSAYLTGLRQRYEDLIKASTTHEELESIVFNYEI